MARRADPEPISIVAAVAAILGVSISAINYWKTHHKPLPHKIRKNLLEKLTRLRLEVGHLLIDLNEVENIFEAAQFVDGRNVRLGNGALLTLSGFTKYERTSDQILKRLSRIHKLVLQIEKLAFNLPFTEKQSSANEIGNLLGATEMLIGSRNFSIKETWERLRYIIEGLEKLLDQLTRELGPL